MAPLEQLMVTKAGGGPLPDPRTAGFGTEQDLLTTLEGAVKDRENLAGSRFTAADLLVAAYLDWYLQFKLLEARPAFVQFASRHRNRPAALRAEEIDNALLKK